MTPPEIQVLRSATSCASIRTKLTQEATRPEQEDLLCGLPPPWTKSGRQRSNGNATPTVYCGRLTCATCSAPRRLRWIHETLAITKARPGQHEIATVVLLPIPMLLVDAKTLRGVLRVVFKKADFRTLLRGGLDVIWDSDPETQIAGLVKFHQYFWPFRTGR